MNDRNDDQFEHEDTPEFDESGDSSGSQNESLEDLIDKMRIVDGNSLTYGEYRKIEQDPEHPIRNPEHPQHGDYLEAKKTMEGIGETLRVSLEGLYPEIDLWEKFKPQVPSFDWMEPEVSEPYSNSHLDAIERLREHEESTRRAMEEQMEEFWAEKVRKEEEEHAYKERVQFAVMNLLESQKQSAEENRKNREQDLKAHAERDEKNAKLAKAESWRSWATLVVAALTLIVAGVTLFVA